MLIAMYYIYLPLVLIAIPLKSCIHFLSEYLVSSRPLLGRGYSEEFNSEVDIITVPHVS